MKKIVSMLLVVVCMFSVVGCSGKNEEVKKTEHNTNEKISKMTPTDSFNYSTENMDEFVCWIKNKDSKKQCGGAFENIIGIYDKKGYILLPVLNGKKSTKVFIDSNAKFINYMFNENAIRICIEPVEANEKNVVQYIDEKYGFRYNKKEKINEVNGNENTAEVETGYEYKTHLVEKKEIEIQQQKVLSVLETKYSKKSETMYNLAFIKDDMLVRVIYPNNANFDLNCLKDLELKKIQIK